MRTSALLSVVLLAAATNASWFASDDKPEYENWDTQTLHAWLENNNIKTPNTYGQKDLRKLVATNWEAHKPWTEQYYNSAQQYFAGVNSDAFEAWDDSKLRSWLVDQGIAEPHGPREALLSSARSRYKSYQSAASSISAQASAAASTAVYGDSTHQASKSAQSIASAASATGAGYTSSVASAASQASKSAASAYATASAFAARKMDDTQDYVYSTWDDNQLRSYLENKGVIKTKQQATRDEMIAKMKSSYSTATDPIYSSWSDSYMKQWLVAHGIVKSDYEGKRDYYTGQLKRYYYTPQEKVWSTWSDSETKAWLVKNGYVKSDAQVTREKMENLVAKNYYNAKDTTWSAWDDSSMRQWLIDNGYMRSDAVSYDQLYPNNHAAAVADPAPATVQKVKRDELVKMMNDKYNNLSGRSSEYLTWPDARLRAYLRAQGVDDTKVVPGDRPSLLQEVRIHYYQANNKMESVFQAIQDTINAGVGSAEARLASILDLIKGKSSEAGEYAASGTDAAKASAYSATDAAKASATSMSKDAKASASSVSKAATSMSKDAKASASSVSKAAKASASSASASASSYAKQAGKKAADQAATAAGGAESQAHKAKKSAEEARDEL